MWLGYLGKNSRLEIVFLPCLVCTANHFLPFLVLCAFVVASGVPINTSLAWRLVSNWWVNRIRHICFLLFSRCKPCKFYTLFLPAAFRFRNTGKSFLVSTVYSHIRGASAPFPMPTAGSTQPLQGGFHPSNHQDTLPNVGRQNHTGRLLGCQGCSYVRHISWPRLHNAWKLP